MNLTFYKDQYKNKGINTAIAKDQLQLLWRYFDEQIAYAYKNNSKNLKVLQRDKVLYLTIYYYGLRVNEASMLNTTDIVHNPQHPEWNDFGGIIIRYAEFNGRIPFKQRIVWTANDALVSYLRGYVENTRSQFAFNECEILFPSEKGFRLNPNTINRYFKAYLKAAGLPYENYSTHSLRYSYISHLSENFVSPGYSFI